MKITDPKTFWEAEDFARPYQMGPQKHRVYMLDLLAKKGVESILDDGCGTGPLYQMIQENWHFAYKGTDYSRTMIETCRELFPNGIFEVEDARHLTEADNSWDCVILLHAIDHLDDYVAAICEAARVSRKYVCIVLWRGFVTDGTRLNDRNMMGKKEGEEPWEDTYLQEYSQEALEKAFIKAGLVIEETAEGEALNSDSSHYNFLYLLRKEVKE
jgi:ubiquinone/menaquinone biosynthesis C-methylase UbiE